MTKPSNILAIEKATKKTWNNWVKYLESIDAKNLSHKEIAKHVYDRLKETQENGGWWAQGITVAYEQHIGRRKPGQRSDGTFEVTVTKTRPGVMDDAMKVWLLLVQGRDEFSDVAITKPPTITQTDKRRHWTCELADGSRVHADVSEKPSRKVLLAITHEKLVNQDSTEKWRGYWKSLLAKA